MVKHKQVQKGGNKTDKDPTDIGVNGAMVQRCHGAALKSLNGTAARGSRRRRRSFCGFWQGIFPRGVIH